MVRISKQSERRAISPRKPRPPSKNRTGAKRDHLPQGYKHHENALAGDGSQPANAFIPKIK
jgi:hypothetical protein